MKCQTLVITDLLSLVLTLGFGCTSSGEAQSGFGPSSSVVIGDTCEQIQLLESALGKALPPKFLAKKMKGHGSSISAVSRVPSDRCELDQRAIFSDVLLTKIDRPYATDGANCWGSTMYLKDLRGEWAYASEPEFSWVLKESKACRPLRENEVVQAGDIGAIRERNSTPGSFNEVHGFVYLTPKYAFSKFDSGFDSPLHVVAASTFWKAYGLEDESAKCQNGTSQSFEGCQQWITYFRCGGPVRLETQFSNLKFQIQLKSMLVDLARDWQAGVSYAVDPKREEEYLARIDSLYQMDSQVSLAEKSILWALIDSIVWQFTAIQYQQQNATAEPNLP